VIKSFRLNQTNRPVDVLLYWSKDKDALLLTPPYQRGDVWGTRRRQNLIKSILLGIPIPSIIVNNRMKAEWKDGDWRIAVIDGKQRITSILMFLNGELPVPGEWFGVDAAMVTCTDLDIVKQRRFENRPMAFSEGALGTIDEEKLVLDLVNFGGLAQGEVDAD